MAKASWGGKVIAESNATVVVEGNQYFPPEAVKKEVLKPSSHTTVCPWKGTAHYYHVAVDGMQNDNAAWFYPEPTTTASLFCDLVLEDGSIVHYKAHMLQFFNMLERISLHGDDFGVRSGGNHTDFSLHVQHFSRP
jgi:uncharacterized protein (DUF427 family)